MLFRAALLSACALAAAQTGPTFGNGLAGVAVCGSKKPPAVVLNYSLPVGASHGVLHHFWITGEREKIDRAWIEYTIDGEAAPSIAFQPAFMCGVGFPSLLSHDFEFSAGGLCGKTAPVGGWNNVFPIPFYKTVLVTARADPSDGPGCFGAYLNVRGTVGLPLVVPGSGRPLPFGARTLLQANALATRQPLEFVVVAELPTGTRGEVFQVSWAVEAQPEGGAAAGGGYIEGCWNFKAAAAEPYPGLVAGCVWRAARSPPNKKQRALRPLNTHTLTPNPITKHRTGVEDYFDSGCATPRSAHRPRADAAPQSPPSARAHPPFPPFSILPSGTTLARTRATRRASFSPTRCRGSRNSTARTPLSGCPRTASTPRTLWSCGTAGC